MIEDFLEEFSKEIRNVPDGFYDTFQFTKTRNNWTHPRTLGYITKILWGLEDVVNVFIDLHINVKRVDEKVKFQPDIFV